MNIIKNIERVERRVKKLESYGFIIEHKDEHVKVPIGNMEYLDIDFSRVHEDKFVEATIHKVFVEGLNQGEKNIKKRFRKLIGIK